MGSPLHHCLARMTQRCRNILIFREDNLAALKHFLEGQSRRARMANVCFNLACRMGRIFTRAVRRLRYAYTKVQPRIVDIAQLPSCGTVPAVRGRCALIADIFLPQCRHYRVTERVAQLRQLGWGVDTCSWCECNTAIQALQLASFVIFYRVPMTGHVPVLFAEARRLGLPIIYDIDDLIFDRTLYATYLHSQSLSSAEVNGLLELADMYRAAMENADILLTSTHVLGEHISAAIHDRHCFVVHNSVSRKIEDAARSLCVRPPRGDGEIRMVYGSGSRTHDADFALIAAPVLEAMREDVNLHLYLHGYLEVSSAFDNYKGRVHRIGFVDRESYFRAIADYDIALMPLESSLFNDAKSNIKYQEASLYGIPSIVSPRADFLEAVTDGEDGIIAHSSEQWQAAILKLASSASLRKNMGEKARQKVLARYACRHVAETELRPALPMLPASDAHRILLVNVFFGISSFGGATMVVEDTARELRQQGFDVYVFSTIRMDTPPAPSLVRYGWDGVTVIAAHACLGGAEEKTPPMQKMFRQALQVVQPNIVHIHCIQGMGLGLVRECARAGIPHIITMHDAWWICPRQFMMDKAEQYCAQQKIHPEVCKARCDLTDEFLYRRRLVIGEAVRQASAIFAPSTFYADFIRRNFPYEASKVRTNRNGIHVPNQPRPTRPGGPIRLGFLGGKAYHKGYFFLAETLQTLGRTDFELVVVDLHTAQNTKLVNKARYVDICHGISARIIPFVSHEAIDSLYAQMDVLLFPSLWDESFGLTVREAIVRDIFVVATDCGGPSEAIVHGENGLLFPKGDKAAFSRHLHHILDNKDVFASYRTSNYGDVISVESQTRELAAAYERIIRREKE